MAILTSTWSIKDRHAAGLVTVMSPPLVNCVFVSDAFYWVPSNAHFIKQQRPLSLSTPAKSDAELCLEGSQLLPLLDTHGGNP